MSEDSTSSMTRERSIFIEALKFSAPAERAAFLDRECAGDASLRAGVESLLKGHKDDDFMAKSGGTMIIGAVTEKPGDKIGRYKLLQQIGEGGCGVVHMADQEEPVKRRVALKVIKPGMDTKEVLGRFEAERQALALMDHPNIAKVLDAGATETGRPFFVMELVRGVPITRYCDGKKLKTGQRLELFIQVCQAIQHAHQKGIIHRDIKPSNVLVADHDGVPVPKIIDFGIAKATTGQKLTDKTVFTALEQFIGTPAYMSPEQANLSGLDIDTRSDIYSLGVLLYELLTGKTPFDAKRLFEAGFDEIRRIIREEEPPRPSKKLSTLAAEEQTTTARERQTDSPRLIHLVRGDLDWIVMKCLEKDRNRRYETANGLASDITRHVNNDPVLARPPSQAYRFQKMVRRNKLLFAAGTAVAAAVLAGLVVSTYLFIQERRAEHEKSEQLKEAKAESEKAKSAAERAKAAEHEQSISRNEAETARQYEARSRQQAEDNAQKAERQAERATLAETVAKQRLSESEAISKFLTEVFQSPNPDFDGRKITVAETLGVATKKLETDLAKQPALQAKLRATIGKTYYALGLYREAILLQEKVREYQAAASSPENLESLDAMQNLANSCDKAGRRHEALGLREDVLKLSQKLHGPESADTIEAMQNLAISFVENYRLDDAIKLQEKALSLCRQLGRPDVRGTLRSMEALAISYGDANRDDDAIKLGEDALELSQKASGQESSDTIKAMSSLAVSHAMAGHFDKAIKLGEEILKIRNLVSGSEKPDTPRAMNYLAIFYDGAGFRQETLELRTQVLNLRTQVLGPEHPDTLEAMHNLAISYYKTGRTNEAIKLQEKALAIRQKVSSEENPGTLDTVEALASFYEAVGRNEEALKLREQVLALRRKVFGSEHPDTLRAIQSLAFSCEKAGLREEAFKLKEEMPALNRKGAEQGDLRAMDALAWELATSDDAEIRDGTNAVRFAQMAVAATHRKKAGFLDTLAASYAEAHQFDKAAATEQEAIGLPLSEAERNAYPSRLKLYQANKPYREPSNP